MFSVFLLSLENSKNKTLEILVSYLLPEGGTEHTRTAPLSFGYEFSIIESSSNRIRIMNQERKIVKREE